jgi:hypothetical protein
MNNGRTLLLLIIVACTHRDKAPDNAAETAPSDSAGWRYAHIEGPDLSFRYPVARVRGVIDRWADDCTVPTPPYGEEPDSTLDGTIIVTSARADFELVADAFGFERENVNANIVCTPAPCAAARPWTMKQGDAWWGEDADSIHAGPWRGLIGTMTTLGYFDDIPDSLMKSPDDDPNATAPKQSMYQTRFFAVAPVTNQCVAVIAWRGEPATKYKRGKEAAGWDTAQIRHMLSTASVGARAAQ